MPLLLHVLGKCLIKIPIIWQQSNKNNTPTQEVFKIFANINVNFAGSSQVVEAIPVCLLLPPLFFSLVCVHIYIRYQGQDQRAWNGKGEAHSNNNNNRQQKQQESKKKLQKRRRRRQAGREAGWKAADDTQEAWPIKFQNWYAQWQQRARSE